MLTSIFTAAATESGTISLPALLLCTAVSLVLGLAAACIYMYRNTYSKSFVVTLALLPVIVQTVILLVNGNLGTGVAVVGAFSLIRFRSVPGSARDISSIFFTMAIGLATGTGYLAIALLLLAAVGLMTLLLSSTRFGEPRQSERDLKITIPENLDYDGLFDDLFSAYTKKAELVRVRTTNMGSLYELQYRVILRGRGVDKAFLDEIRCRNGNLSLSCGQATATHDEL